MGDLINAFNAVKDAIGPVGTNFLVVMVAIGGLLKSIEAVLQIIAPITPFKWDDNLATLLGKLLANKIFQKKV